MQQLAHLADLDKSFLSGGPQEKITTLCGETFLSGEVTVTSALRDPKTKRLIYPICSACNDQRGKQTAPVGIVRLGVIEVGQKEVATT